MVCNSNRDVKTVFKQNW